VICCYERSGRPTWECWHWRRWFAVSRSTRRMGPRQRGHFHRGWAAVDVGDASAGRTSKSVGAKPSKVGRGQRWQQAASNGSRCRACTADVMSYDPIPMALFERRQSTLGIWFASAEYLEDELEKVGAQPQSKQAPFCDPESCRQSARTFLLRSSFVSRSPLTSRFPPAPTNRNCFPTPRNSPGSRQNGPSRPVRTWSSFAGGALFGFQPQSRHQLTANDN
jgi:hypothetical protein